MDPVSAEYVLERVQRIVNRGSGGYGVFTIPNGLVRIRTEKEKLGKRRIWVEFIRDGQTRSLDSRSAIVDNFSPETREDWKAWLQKYAAKDTPEGPLMLPEKEKKTVEMNLLGARDHGKIMSGTGT